MNDDITFELEVKVANITTGWRKELKQRGFDLDKMSPTDFVRSTYNVHAAGSSLVIAEYLSQMCAQIGLSFRMAKLPPKEQIERACHAFYEAYLAFLDVLDLYDVTK